NHFSAFIYTDFHMNTARKLPFIGYFRKVHEPSAGEIQLNIPEPRSAAAIIRSQRIAIHVTLVTWRAASTIAQTRAFTLLALVQCILVYRRLGWFSFGS